MSESSTRLSLQENGGNIAVSGDIDAYTAPELAAKLDPLPGAGDLVLDLTEVGFMDSSGIRVLVATHQKAEEADRVLRVTGANRAVRRILEISGLLDHLNVD